MLIAQWILEITDILMNKIVSFWKKSVMQSRATIFFVPPPNPKIVPTALYNHWTKITDRIQFSV